MPKVLVTGGAGFIGSFVAERFARADFSVRVLDDLSSGSRDNCDAAWDLAVADVREADAVDRAVAGCDVVVHLAAFTSVPESMLRFADCYETNVHGTLHVLDACAGHGVRKLVFASSSAVYGDATDAPKREDDCPGPISPYAVSKLEGEHLLEIWGATRGLASAALRFFNVYGPRQPADSDYAAAIPIFAERGFRGEPLTIYGDGRQTRDFVFVEDVAEAVFRAATGEFRGVCNIGTGDELEIGVLADTIARLTGSQAKHRFADPRPGDVRASTADVSVARERLDWTPARSLESGLEPTLAWWRERVG